MADKHELNLGFNDAAVGLTKCNGVASLYATARDTANGVLTLIAVPSQCSYQHLERLINLHGWSWYVSSNGFKNNIQATVFVGVSRRCSPGLASAANGVVDRVVQLIFVYG